MGEILSGRWIRRELVLASTKGQFIRQNAKNEKQVAEAKFFNIALQSL
jgi:glutathionyl-hydroquinone reductase